MPAISIIEAFADLPDPRLDRSKLHKLSDILVVTPESVTLCKTIAG